MPDFVNLVRGQLDEAKAIRNHLFGLQQFVIGPAGVGNLPEGRGVGPARRHAERGRRCAGRAEARLGLRGDAQRREQRPRSCCLTSTHFLTAVLLAGRATSSARTGTSRGTRRYLGRRGSMRAAADQYLDLPGCRRSCSSSGTRPGRSSAWFDQLHRLQVLRLQEPANWVGLNYEALTDPLDVDQLGRAPCSPRCSCRAPSSFRCWSRSWSTACRTSASPRCTG